MGHKKFSTLRDKMPPESQRRARAKTAKLMHEMALAELRTALDLTQEDVARQLGKGQDAVSKVERRADMYISTLRNYITAVGGSLEIIANIGGERVFINQFSLIAAQQNKIARGETAE